MKITERLTIQVGSFDVNCSIINIDGDAWIVDPGCDGKRILGICEEHGLMPKALLLTHAHFDHIGGVPAIQSTFPTLPIFVGRNDVPIIDHPMNQFPPDYPPIAKPDNLKCAEALCESSGIQVISTPGHTPGGVCYYFEEDALLLSGDTLFAGSIGRTDLPGGNMANLVDSLRALKKLPDATVVVPGHGPTTTIGREKASNPFMQF